MTVLWKQIVRALSPPLLYEAAASWNKRKQPGAPALEYVPSGWQKAASYGGWNAESVLEAYKATWPRLVRESQTTDPFNFIMGSDDVVMHNILLCFTYSLALAAREKSSLSLLDWGGAIGQYNLLAQAALPGVDIDYHCKDVPLLADYGQTLHPEAHFFSDGTCLTRTYSFVLASSALHYSEDWHSVLHALARATAGYFLLTRTPVHEEGPAFVFSQRAYGSEWLGWSLSEAELRKCAEAAGLELVRKFCLSSDIIPIPRAPSPSKQCGFLFRPALPVNPAHPG